ncbi:hypothetical protein DM47_4728 [Burkholderia mallei]|nr:hypothetical protein DM46_4434 [Burkholderia mallei]KOS94709.1 hypothetical protein DM45_3304 [Burkholderia mallei]KOT04157.1 hypothetical protein DM50_4851 [Burkholderia mallei]KOT11336.1 hypothetical protein DM77_2798 [Burkholderia mallei]KOT23754.1 hypothetical protein DM47_4728 [Burkholderia mallei]
MIVEHGRGRPLVRRDLDRAEHPALRGAVARQRLDRRELAQVAILARRPGVALDAPLDEAREPGLELRAHVLGQREARVGAARLVGEHEQVRGQRRAAGVRIVGRRREVAREPVAVEVDRHPRGERLPLRGVAQADRARRLLFEAAVRIALEPAAHAGQPVGERRLQRHGDAAARRAARVGHGAGGRRDGHAQRAVDLRERRLLDRHGQRRHDLLRERERVGRALAALLGRLDAPVQRARGVERRLGHRDVPRDFLRGIGRERYLPRRRVDARHARRDDDVHLALGRVAHRHLRAERVAFAHERRQARDQLQILRAADRRAAGAEALRARRRDRDDPKARERIVERHVDARAAVRVERDARVPQQQRVEQLAGRRHPAAAARGHGLASEVAAADDLHLRGGRLDAVRAPLQHRIEQVPTAVRHQLEERLVDRGERDLRAGGRGLAVRQRDLHARVRGAAHRIAGRVGRHRDAEPVRARADLDLAQAVAERGLRQVDERARRLVAAAFAPERARPFEGRLPAPREERVPRHVAQPPAQREHRYVDVRPPRVADLQIDGRILAVQLDDARLHHAAALDGDERRGMAKRHAHLEARGVARLVRRFLGDHVDPVGVLAAEPEIVLARDPYRRRRVRRAAVAVLRDRDQLHVARLRERGVARQPALRVGLARAQHAQLARVALVVVRVEAADHPLARGGRHARDALDLDRRRRARAALQIDNERLHRHALADRHPVARLDAGDDRGRPQHRVAANRLHLAVRIGERRLERDALGRVDGRQALQRERARAGAIERERDLVGDELRRVGIGVARRVLAVLRVLVVGRRVLRLRAVRLEAEIGIALGERRLGALDERRHLHGQVRRAAARHVIDLHRERRVLRADERARLRVAHADRAFEDGQPERLDAEAAAVVARARRVLGAVLELDAVFAELRRRGQREARVGGVIGGPCERHAVRLAAAEMADRRARRVARREREAPQRLLAHEVLHRYRLARAHERAVEHRMRAHGRRVAHVGRHVEAPRFDAAVPARAHERHVGARLRIVDAGGHEIVAVAVRAVACALGLEGRIDRDEPLRVGPAGRDFVAVAVGHAHLRVRHGLALVERRHPDDAVLAAELQMHAEVRDEHRGAHVHLRGLGEQRAAERGRRELEHVKARLVDRQADDLERAQRLRVGLRQRQRPYAGLAREQRQRADVDLPVLRLRRALARGERHVDGMLAAREQAGAELVDRLDAHRAAVETLDELHPAADLAVVLDLQVRELRAARVQPRDAQVGLDVAQRDGHERGRIRLGEALDDAERARRELRERRHRRGARREREQIGVRQRAARHVAQRRRQLDRQRGLRGQRRGELYARDFLRAIVGLEERLDRAVRAAQPDLAGGAARHRRVERQRERAQRRARRLRVLALAREARGERRAHREVVAPLGVVRDAARARDAAAVDELHLRARGQRLRAREREHARGVLFPVEVIEERGARRRVGGRHRDAVADAGGLAPDARERRAFVGRAVQLDDEHLPLFDLARARPYRDRERAARLEREAARARHRVAGGRAQRVVERDRAAYAGRQIVLEVIGPGLLVEPAAVAARGGGIGAREARGGRRGRRAERDHRLVELDDGLPDFGDGALRRHVHGARRVGVQRQRGGRAERRGRADAREQTEDRRVRMAWLVVLVVVLHRAMALGGKLSV